MDLSSFKKVKGPAAKKSVYARPSKKSSHLAMSIPLHKELGEPSSCGVYVSEEDRKIALNFADTTNEIHITAGYGPGKKKSEAIVRKGKQAFSGLNVVDGPKEYEIIKEADATWLIIDLGDPNEPGTTEGSPAEVESEEGQKEESI